jgi:phage shock protein C
MYCSYCGKSIAEDSNVCAYCGKRVSGVVARQRLVRPRQGRKVAGVCLAFAEYFDIDVMLIRIVWAVCLICAGVGAVAYCVAWIVIPDEPLLLPGPAPTQNSAVNNN